MRAGRHNATARLAAALLQRELSARDAVLFAALAAVGVLVALKVSAAAPPPTGDPLTRMVRRFDLLAVGIAAATACIRVAVRIGEDHASGWIAPWVAAAGSRAGYAIALAACVAAGTSLLLLAGALPFAVAAAWAGSPDLLRVLPRVLMGGVLLIGALTCHTLLAGLIARVPAWTLLLAGVTATAPYVAAALHLMEAGGAMPPFWIRGWLAVAPPLALASAPEDYAHQLAFAGVALAAGALIAHVRAGRRP